MLSVISPAKTLDYETTLPTDKHTLPRLLNQSEQLIEVCRELSASQIASLMSVSDKIATLNADRFRDWTADLSLANARQAIYAFKGDVYTGLDAYSLKQADIEFAQTHLRMLSGLYGLLRPLDLMMPYRLEMGTKLHNPRGHNLYEFWDDQITQLIIKVMRQGQKQSQPSAIRCEYDAPLLHLSLMPHVQHLDSVHLAIGGTAPMFADEHKSV